MQVKNGLAAVGVRINDDAITVIGESLIACNCGRGQEQMSEQIFISPAGRVGRVDMPPGNDQDDDMESLAARYSRLAIRRIMPLSVIRSGRKKRRMTG